MPKAGSAKSVSVGGSIKINSRNYTLLKREPLFGNPDTERYTLQTKSGDVKTALFYKGEFDVWERISNSRYNPYTNINMRGRIR